MPDDTARDRPSGRALFDELVPSTLRPGKRAETIDVRPVLPAGGATPEDESLLGEWGQVLLQRLHVVLGVAALVTLATALFASRLEPRYTARATLELANSAPNVLSFRDIVDSESQWYGVYDQYRQTQIRVLESRKLAAAVVRRQQLDADPRFLRDPAPPPLPLRALRALRSAVAGLVASPPQAAPGADGEGAVQEVDGVPVRLVDRARGGLEVVAEPRTRLLSVRYTSADPALSADLANAFAEGYRKHVVESKRAMASEARDFLERELGEIEHQLRGAEEELNAFRREHGLLGPDGGENTTVRKVQQLNDALAAAQVRRIELEASMSLVEEGQTDALPEVLASEVVQQLKQRLAALEADRGRMSQRLKPGYPRYDALLAELAETRVSLDAEMRRIGEGVRVSYEVALRRERELRAALDQIRDEALAEKDEFVTYQVLAREVETSRGLYNGLLQRLMEAGVAAGVETSNVALVDAAVPPGAPSFPNVKKLLVLGLIVGLGLGLGTAVLLSLGDNALYTPELTSRYLGLATLGFVPEATAAAGPGEAAREKGPGKERRARIGAGVLARRAAPVERTDLAALDDASNPLSEAFRVFRASLLLSSPERAPRCILVTSAQQGEGKTLTTLNTALVLAQAGMRGVIVDADLRRPRIHRAAGVSNDVGLASYLAGQAELRDVAQPALHENLFVIPAGPRAPNPSELLGSTRMAETLEQLSERCDFVICDAPPVLPVADSLSLAGFCDGVVLVVDAMRTPRQVVRAARDKLLAARAPILGVVLNRAPTRSSRFRYGPGRYHYRSYYRSYESDYHTEESAA